MKAKKYSRISQHTRNVGHSAILVRAHIRKNPKYKETKMETDERIHEEQEELRDLTGKKESRPCHVNVNIREADNHYLVSFNHGNTRVFHEMKELLTAIKVKVTEISHG